MALFFHFIAGAITMKTSVQGIVSEISEENVFVDFTAPLGDVIVEVDHRRGVIYIHAEGRSVVRMSRVKGGIHVAEHGK